jgi:hypothetical protein
MMVLCVALFVSWPVLVGVRPGPSASVAVNQAYAVKFVTYLSCIVLALILAGIGAIVIMRRTAAEYRAAQMQNMKELIEATLRDQQRKSESPNDSPMD